MSLYLLPGLGRPLSTLNTGLRFGASGFAILEFRTYVVFWVISSVTILQLQSLLIV